jgi:hypothetical protein
MDVASSAIQHLRIAMIRKFLTFDSFIFPRIASLVYWVGLVLIFVFTLASAIAALFMGSQVAQIGLIEGPLGFAASIFGGLVGIIVWRVVVEFWLIIFSIHEALRDIHAQGERD